MNVTCAKSGPCNIKKKIFTLKPVQKNGLILQIHHTTTQYSVCQKRNIPHRIRFIFTTFDKSSKIVASADIAGNIFIIDFSSMKFWLLPKFESCSALKFSSENSEDLLIATNNAKLFILNIHTGCITALWEEHKEAIKDIYFANEMCLAASSQEAIIFNLKTFKKLHALKLKNCTSLKLVMFTPITNNILACFSDYFINIWDGEKFNSIKQIMPAIWKKQTIKSIAFTRNGELMVLGGHSPFLILFSMNTWSVTKTISLPIELNSIRLLDFVSHDNDGGFNRILIILSSDGILYFYDMLNQEIINKMQHQQEITTFELSKNGQILACVLHSGEVNIYKTSFLTNLKETVDDKKEIKLQQKLKLFLPQQKKMSDILDIEKLRSILIEFGEYPNTYRPLIWTKMLSLPNNKQCYCSFINRDNTYFKNLETIYPLMNKASLKNLKKLLNNLANWCSFFAQVEFLPLFVFPFLKIYENDPIHCFEVVCTVLINFCQHWFEYSPFPPINILAIIENVFLQHDEALMFHLTKCGITSHLYAWSILEVAFSEVLTIKEWCILWDHILTNEPSYILMAVVAYNIMNRSTLLSFTKMEEFEYFYHSQNLLCFKRFISKTYYLMKNTSEDIHPRQYLNDFNPLSRKEYPVFLDYPNIIKDRLMAGEEKLNSQDDYLKNLHSNFDEQKTINLKKMRELNIIEEERKRIEKLEAIYKNKILRESERIKFDKEPSELNKNDDIQLDFCNEIDNEETFQKRKRELDNILSQTDDPKNLGNEVLKNMDTKINENVCQLLKQKLKLKELMRKTSNNTDNKSSLGNVQRKQELLQQEHLFLQKDLKKILKKLKVGDMKKIKINNTKLSNLEASTRDIEKQVEGLIKNMTKRPSTNLRNVASNKPVTLKTKVTKKKIKSPPNVKKTLF